MYCRLWFTISHNQCISWVQTVPGPLRRRAPCACGRASAPSATHYKPPGRPVQLWLLLLQHLRGWWGGRATGALLVERGHLQRSRGGAAGLWPGARLPQQQRSLLVRPLPFYGRLPEVRCERGTRGRYDSWSRCALRSLQHIIVELRMRIPNTMSMAMLTEASGHFARRNSVDACLVPWHGRNSLLPHCNKTLQR